MRGHILQKSIITIITAICLSMTAGLPERVCGQEIDESVDFQMAANLEIISGDTLFGYPGDTLEPMVVSVLDDNGNVIVDSAGIPIPIPVTFTITEFPEGATGQSLIPGDSIAVVYTDDLGMASVRLVFGDSVGLYEVTATADTQITTDHAAFVGITAGAPFNVVVEATSPHVADDLDSTIITVSVYDYLGSPVPDAEILTSLFIGEDESEGKYATNLGKGNYSSSLATREAGTGVIEAFALYTAASAYTSVEFVPGPTEDISIVVREEFVTDTTTGYLLWAAAEDSFFNNIPYPLSNIEITTTFGEITPTSFDTSARVYSATVQSSYLGTGTVVATDLVSGYSDTLEVSFPAISLSSDPRVVSLTGLPDEDRMFRVAVDILVEPGKYLNYYELVMSFDTSMSRFHSAIDGDPGDAFGQPAYYLPNPGTLVISRLATPGEPLPTGHVYPAELIFECLDEGVSKIIIEEATLRGCDTPKGGKLQDLPSYPRKHGKCPNKSKRKLCVNPILVKGSTTTKKTIIEKLRHLQDNLDKACCEIEVRVCGSNLKKATKDDVRELKVHGFTTMSGYSERLRTTSDHWYLTLLLPDDWISLIESADKKGLRKKDCINVFIVGSMPGKGGSLPPKMLLYDAGFLAADDHVIAEKIVKKSNPSKELQKKKYLCTVMVDDGGFTSGNGLTIKHEIGHALGLMHPNLYRDKATQKATKPSVMETCDGKGSHFTKKQCEIIEMNLGGYLKDIEDP
jgi:hypothetical protein